MLGLIMDSQQLLDHIIKPTIKYMGGNYDSLNARMLLLSTAAIESNCGHKIKQDGGPALGPWQMEPKTEQDIWNNCDALKRSEFLQKIDRLDFLPNFSTGLLISPMYACAMARLKYSMDKDALPHHSDKYAIYVYYKRIYNTPLGASTWDKFRIAWDQNGLDKVKLS